MSAWTKQCAAAVGVSTPRAPIGATVSKDTNSHRTTFAKVPVSQKLRQTLLTSHIKVTALQMLLHGPTTEASRHHLRFMKRLQGVSGFLCFLRPPFSSSISSLQMWTSACSLESVSMVAVSIWKAPTNAPVTMVTKSHQTAETVKVCKGLCRAVGCNSPLHTSHLVELSWQQNNVFK